MFLFIVIIIVLLPVLYLELKIRKTKQLIRHTAGPKTLPLVGNAHQVGKTPSGKMLKNEMKNTYRE